MLTCGGWGARTHQGVTAGVSPGLVGVTVLLLRY